MKNREQFEKFKRKVMRNGHSIVFTKNEKRINVKAHCPETGESCPMIWGKDVS